MIPRVQFAHLPTPIESLPRLGKILDLPGLFVKRDDQTGLGFGGNKTRKLEFLVADAQAHGAKTLITAGAIQSNHCRQTAAAAAKFGFHCILVLMGDLPSAPSANLLLDGIFGAEIIYAGDRKDRDQILTEIFQKAVDQEKKPYLVPYGGSNAIGVLGYVFAIQEFMSQMSEVDWIVFASSSGGTQAGLTLGSRVFGYAGKLLGISIDEPSETLSPKVAELSTAASMLLGDKYKFGPRDININDQYCSAGYGILTDKECEAIRLFACSEGLLLDPVYTGRAAAGLIDLARKGFFRRDDTVLFWHTGGQPALFASQYGLDKY